MIDAFLVDRAARGLSVRTVAWYQEKLGLFSRFLDSGGIRAIDKVTAHALRSYILFLGQSHNAGGVHGHFRAVRALLRWWEDETEPRDWVNPLRRVRPPKVPLPPLEPVPLADVRAMVATCSKDSFEDLRDRAVLLGLLDTGCRASEFVGFAVGDIHLRTGEATVRRGKGAKSRVVFFGQTARAALQAYLAVHPCPEPLASLWVGRDGSALAYFGLRELVRRRAKKAGVSAPPLHSFRRAFALGCLRNGVDVISLQRLLGHADLSILNRYLAQTTNDLQRAHGEGGPVDRLFGEAEPEPDPHNAQSASGRGSGGPKGRRVASSCQAAESDGRHVGSSATPVVYSAGRARATAQRAQTTEAVGRQVSGNGHHD